MPTLDLVLADLRLPGAHDGIGAIGALRASRAAPLQACLVTGESHAASLQAARDSGLTLLHKPVRAAQLRAAFNHLVAQSLAPTSPMGCRASDDARHPAPAAPASRRGRD